MSKLKIVSLLVLSILTVSVSGQNKNIQKLKNKKLTYYWVGKICPNFSNPELRYGFSVKCVGDNPPRRTNRNNKRVVRKINSVYGKNWFEENRSNL
jgi:hypothetical protein